MKGFVFCFSTVLLFSCTQRNEQKNKVVAPQSISYGEVAIDPQKAISVDEMLTCFENNGNNAVFTFKAPVSEVCSKAGCWVNIDKGNGETFMVRFKNHFTIPVKTKVNTEAIIHGFAHADTISVKSLRHFAEDAGKSKEEIEKITEPQYEFGFQADGIMLLK
ncbi:MAG: DUF4920 domain-containing protein [Flavobacteriia bacterium]|nr:DUF4920 domain-containing protein [Flavobacteriia bacterium]